MRPDGEPSSAKVGHHSFFVRHGCERRFVVNFWKLVQQRSGPAYGTLNLPQRIAAMKFNVLNFTRHCIQRADLSQRLQLILAQLGYTTSQILNRSEWRQAALPNQRLPRRLAQAACVVQADAN